MTRQLSGLRYFQDSQIYVGLFPQQTDVMAHSHPFYELVFFEHGLLNHQWEGRRNILTAGDLFCIRPGEVHLYTRSKDAKLYNCLFLPEAIPEGIAVLPGIKRLLSGAERLRLHIPVAKQKQLKEILQQMILELQNKASGFQEVLSALLSLILVFAGRELAGTQVKDSGYAPAGKVQAALAYLETHWQEKIKLEQVATAHNLSPEQFSRLASQLVGISPLQYLQNIRLSQAMELLLTSELPISEIADSVGFEDPNYFARLFRSRVGQSPSQFRTRKGLT